MEQAPQPVRRAAEVAAVAGLHGTHAVLSSGVHKLAPELVLCSN